MIGRNSYVLGFAKTSIIVGVFCLVFSPLFPQPPKKAEAQIASAVGSLAACFGINSLFSLASSVGSVANEVISVPVSDATTQANTSKTSTNTGGSLNKECSLDAIAFALAKVILEDMANNFINYINNGFEGDPFFLTSPGDYFKGLADEIVGEFISQAGLDFLCKPFQLQLRNALKIRYGGGGKARYREKGCTLTDVVNNVEGFLDGNFKDGSWLGFIEITQEPLNNPVGAYLSIQGEIDDRIAEKLGIESKQLDWNFGFLSQKTTGPDGKETIVTPGNQIENQLATYLGSGVRQLELADEFNEILSALFNQLLKQAFSKTGLAGHTSTGPGIDQPTYEEDIAELRLEGEELIQQARTLISNNPGRLTATDITNLDYYEKFINESIAKKNRIDLINGVAFMRQKINEIVKRLEEAGTYTPPVIDEPVDEPTDDPGDYGPNGGAEQDPFGGDEEEVDDEGTPDYVPESDPFGGDE